MVPRDEEHRARQRAAWRRDGEHRVTLSLAQIRDLAYRFVPVRAAADRLYDHGARSWWPAHEIGHFLVATRSECRRHMFGLDFVLPSVGPRYQYAVAKEIAAVSVSQ